MVSNGLLDEVTAFHRQYSTRDTMTRVNHQDEDTLFHENQESLSGVTVAIGYKELIPYILEREKIEAKSFPEPSSAGC
jgi:hypothetical protein